MLTLPLRAYLVLRFLTLHTYLYSSPEHYHILAGETKRFCTHLQVESLVLAAYPCWVGGKLAPVRMEHTSDDSIEEFMADIDVNHSASSSGDVDDPISQFVNDDDNDPHMPI